MNPEGSSEMRPRLLVVDDEPDITDLLTEVAEDLGFHVTQVHDGNDFAEAYGNILPAVIILDLNLPGIDGVQILRFLDKQNCRAKILLASGMDMRTLAAATKVGSQYNLDIAGQLAKPLLLEDIEAALRPLLQNEDWLSKNDLRRAFKNGEFVVHYQPKISFVNSSDGKMEGVEALVRWHRADGTVVPPNSFLPHFRSHGLMHEMTEIVTDTALRATKQWQEDGLQIMTSINLDGVMLNDLSLPDLLSDKSKRFGVSPSNITFEITEAAAMNDTAKTMDILTRLRVKNFNVSLDDFGTGYSSLVQLYRMPFNELKIDKSFVIDINKNPEAGIIVETLTILGHKLGLKVCAEGIETREMLEFVKMCGCDLGQGYLFSKPVEANAIGMLFRKLRPRDGAPIV